MTSSLLDDIPCDLSYLLGNLGGNRESARRLIGIYLDNYPKLRSSLEASFAARDLEALHNLIHDIRGGLCAVWCGPLHPPGAPDGRSDPHASF